MWEVILSKKAQGDLETLRNVGLFDKVKHRFVYRVIKETKTIEVLRMWSHYE